MMRHAMSRKAATTGGFTTSVIIHSALLLLFFVLMRAGPAGVEEVMDELTEIAYIEARYGEDVAKKVRLKTKPQPVVQEQAPPEELAETEPEQPDVPTPQPTLESKPMLQTRPRIDTRSVLKPKTLSDIEAPKLTPEQQRQFLDTTSRRLDAKKFAEASVPGLNTDNLRNPSALADDIAAPSLQSKERRADFQGDNVALVGKKSSLDLSEVDFEVGASGSGGGRMTLEIATGGSADGHAGLVGGSLQEGQVAYQGSVADLVQTAKSNQRNRALEVEAPAVEADNASGRRTLLDYGGAATTPKPGLSGRRPALAEAPSATDIAEAEPAAEEPVQIAEAAAGAMAGKGVSMTVSGQIVGRKIVKSTTPVYSEEARRKGWEGVVAVHFTVMPDGRVKDNMYFDQTSAHRDLNRAAMDAVKQFRFAPLGGGKNVEQWGVITIVFRLS
jgi:TonB family protein